MVFNPLSKEGGGGGLGDVFAKISVRSIYPSFVQIPRYL